MKILKLQNAQKIALEALQIVMAMEIVTRPLENANVTQDFMETLARKTSMNAPLIQILVITTASARIKKETFFVSVHPDGKEKPAM